jgi:hypothetical protein
MRTENLILRITGAETANVLGRFTNEKLSMNALILQTKILLNHIDLYRFSVISSVPSKSRAFHNRWHMKFNGNTYGTMYGQRSEHLRLFSRTFCRAKNGSSPSPE